MNGINKIGIGSFDMPHLKAGSFVIGEVINNKEDNQDIDNAFLLSDGTAMLLANGNPLLLSLSPEPEKIITSMNKSYWNF